MSQLRTQLQMSGPRELANAAEVQAYWRDHANDWLEKTGVRFPNRPQRELFHEDGKTELVAYVSDGRWVADCPARRCNGGIALLPGHEQAACLDCGTIYSNISWPAENLHAEAETALMARPEQNRHWKPWLETPETLRHENIRYGFGMEGKPAAGSVQEIAATAGLSPAVVEKVLRALDQADKTDAPAVLER